MDFNAWFYAAGFVVLFHYQSIKFCHALNCNFGGSPYRDMGLLHSKTFRSVYAVLNGIFYTLRRDSNGHLEPKIDGKPCNYTSPLTFALRNTWFYATFDSLNAHDTVIEKADSDILKIPLSAVSQSALTDNHKFNTLLFYGSWPVETLFFGYGFGAMYMDR